MMRKSGKLLAHVSKLALLVNFLTVFSNNYALAGKGHESQPGQKLRNVAMLVWDGAVLLDFTGPAEVFSNVAGGKAFRVYTVAETPEPARSGGVIIKPEFTFADAPKADIILIPGGNFVSAQKNRKLIEWIQKAAPGAEIVFSVCTGAFVLAETGLLDGLNATTHHFQLKRFGQEFPKVNVVGKQRFVDNGKFVTAGGVSAGIDAALYIVERLAGVNVARFTAETQMQSEYWKPAAALGETFTGTLMPVKCRNDDPVNHTRECALEPDCVATGFGLLLADETFLEFDKAGSEKALAALKASAKKSDLKARVVGVRNGLSLNVESVEIL
jgi:putative intracellular protease/amidase